MSRILITGMGVISAIGDTVAENHAALKAGRCGMSHLEMLTSHFAEKMPFGEVKISTPDLKKNLNVLEPGVTRTSLLALKALNEASLCSGLSAEQIHSPDTALIVATTVGGMCLTDEMYSDANLHAGGSEYLSSYDFASVTLFLQQQYNIKGIVNTINTACSSSANAIMYGARLIQHGFAKRALVGGADSLAKFTINGFNALGILSGNICMPFDKERKGLNLGEGAAFLVLEREEDCAGKNKYAELTGYCNANDAFHPSSLSEQGDGPCLAMKGALEIAGLMPDDIDFINAHGTGTENNDAVESTAMRHVFNKMPDFASTKSNTGHTLGASGAIEAVYSILNLKYQEVYPGLNFSEAIPVSELTPVQAYRQQMIRHVISNSFGFGGNCSSLIFSRA